MNEYTTPSSVTLLLGRSRRPVATDDATFHGWVTSKRPPSTNSLYFATTSRRRSPVSNGSLASGLCLSSSAVIDQWFTSS